MNPDALALREKIIAAQVKSLGLHYQKIGRNAAKNGKHAKDCKYKNHFKHAHWIKGYYMFTKENR